PRATSAPGFMPIGGLAGGFAGVSMLAGYVFIFVNPGIRIGAGMKRGTIVLLGERPPLLPTCRPDCVYRPVFLDLYLRQLQAWGMAVPSTCLRSFYERHSGDHVSLGKGEILHWRGNGSN